MTTRIYEFGSTAAGLHFTITATENANGLIDFDVNVISGSFDLNAVYWGDGDKTDDDLGLPGQNNDLIGFSGKPSENSLNMNGDNVEYDSNGVATASKVVYDGGIKLSDTGLGSAGTNKGTYLTAGEHYTFSADIDFADFSTVGVRATSTSTAGGSIKWVDCHAEPPPPPEHHDCPVLFSENFDHYDGQYYQDNGVNVFAVVDMQAAGPDTENSGNWAAGQNAELGANGYGTIESTSGGFWFDTMRSPGQVDMSHTFVDTSAAVGGKTSVLSFDVAKQSLDYHGQHYATDPNASLEFRIDGQTVKTINASDLATSNDMYHVEVNVAGYAGAGPGHTLELIDTTANAGFTGFSVDSIQIKDACDPHSEAHNGSFLFVENFDEQPIQVFKSSGVDTSASIDLVSQGWTGTGHNDQFGFTTTSEVVKSGMLGNVPSTSGDQWLDTQNTPGGINISHAFTDNTAAAGGKTSVLSFDIAKLDLKWDGNPYQTDPNASFQFKIDNAVVAEIHASDLATNQMTHFDVDIAGYAGAGDTHTLTLTDTTLTAGYFGFAVDTIAIHDWVI